MSHFVKGQGLVRTSFKSNVELRSANLDFVAGKYIVNPRAGFAEGLSSVTVNDESIGKALITNPASLTEVRLPAEYTAIGPKAFDGCANLTGIYVYAGQVISISEDAIPSGCAVYVDYEFVTEYQTLHPTLDIRGFDSGYVYEIPYVEGVTPTTLTAQYINDLVEAMGDAKDNVGKVVVPLYFTAYENGSIGAIISAFTNMEHLVTTYEAGNVDLDMNGDIVAKITEIGKTVDEALVLAKNIANGTSVIGAIILPPLRNFAYGYDSSWRYTQLVYAPYLEGAGETGAWPNYFKSCTSLIELNATFTGSTVSIGAMLQNVSSIKRVSLTFANGASITGFNPFAGCSSLEKVLLYNMTSSVAVSSSAQFTRQALVDLFNSLGTPSSFRYLTIGETNYAKLTDADVQIAHNKNWWVGWTETTTIPYNGETTLTASYLNTLLGYPGKERCTKVIIPAEFTDYESGVITSIISGLTNLRTIDAHFEAGDVELDLQGDIVAKIASIGKTPDEALVYAKYVERNLNTTGLSLFNSNNDLIIIPPINYNGSSYFAKAWEGFVYACPNLVSVEGLRFTGISNAVLFYRNAQQALVKMHVRFANYIYTTDDAIFGVFSNDSSNSPSLKYFRIDCENGSGPNMGMTKAYGLEYVILNGLSSDFDISSSSNFTRASLLDVCDSLADLTGQTGATLTIGATNLAKLTAEDIAEFTAKNWQLA